MSAVFSPLSTPDFNEVSQAYGLGVVNSAMPVSEGSVNTIYVLDTSQGRFYLRLEEARTPEDLAAELRFTAFLALRGFPTPAPRPLRQRGVHGDFIFVLRDRLISLCPECPGESKAAGEFVAADFSALGELLAQLHRLGEAFPEPLTDRFNLAALAGWFNTLKPQLGAEHASPIASIETEFLIQQREAPALRALPQTIVHADLFADNLFFKETYLTGLIDFDAATRREAIFDLATAVNALCFHQHEFHWPSISALFTAYEQVRPLSADERARWMTVWRLSSLRFTVTRIKDFEVRKAGQSGLMYRDYRDFLRRLELQRLISEKKFWAKIQ